MIPLDFVAGTHGNFLEIVLNKSLGFCDLHFSPFTPLGTSHNKPADYLQSRVIKCNHWFENDCTQLLNSDLVIRIVFDQLDLLTVSSNSLLRAGDFNIDNNLLEFNTRSKLKNKYYHSLLTEIYDAYPFISGSEDIPRYVLREFFKYSFKNPNINGYWKKLQSLLSIPVKNEFQISLDQIYDINQLQGAIRELSKILNTGCQFDKWFELNYYRFLEKNTYLAHRIQCDDIIKSVVKHENKPISSLTLLQESYINGNLENIFRKEMPFRQEQYFLNTQDMLYYIKYQAPDLPDDN